MVIEKFRKVYKKLFEWEKNIMSEELKENVESECASISLRRMMQDVLWCKQELLNESILIDKKEMYDRLLSLEHRIKLLNDENNHIDREDYL